VKVLVVNPSIKEWFEEHRDRIPEEVEIISPTDDSDLCTLAADVQVIVTTRLSEEVVYAAKQLKLIQKTGAGMDAIPFDVIPDDVVVANTSGANPVPMAEGTIALMFALAKQIVQKHSNFPDRHPLRGVELRDKHVAIVGMGSIGKEIARRLVPFGMKVHGIQRNPKQKMVEEFSLASCVGSEHLMNILKISDFVLLTVPLTPETRGMIGESELRAMKSTSYLVNIGRAGLIEEGAMYNALKDKWIAGAALDVWWVPHWWDPSWNPELRVPSRYPIWEFDNVIAIPHNIGFVERTSYSSQALEIIAKNISNVFYGKEIINTVDKIAQY